MNWSEILETRPEPILVIGNPPWVTNATLSTLDSNNIPQKSNFDNLRGIDALTGKSNFDISEWMLRKSIEWLDGKHGALAILCKTSVARKVLLYAWQHDLRIESALVYIFDAHEHFGASVDACLLFVRSNPIGKSKECSVFRSFHAQKPDTAFGLQDVNCWRLGIKHDCSKVFESRVEHRNLVNKECDTARMLAERQMVEYTAGLHQRLLFREETADYGSEPVRNIVSWKV